MTRLARWKLDEWSLVWEKCHYVCEQCGQPVHDRHGSAAHVIKNNESNRDNFGQYVMSSHYVLKGACSNKCNNLLELRQYKDSGEYRAVLKRAILYVKNKGLPLGPESEKMLSEMKRGAK